MKKENPLPKAKKEVSQAVIFEAVLLAAIEQMGRSKNKGKSRGKR